MKKELIFYVLRNLNNRRLRNILTILSIVIGISAVFILLSFGQGLSKYTNDMFEKMGTDKIIFQTKSLMPGSLQNLFTEDDYSYIKSFSDLSEVSGILFSTIDVQRNTKTSPISAYISGVPTGREKKLVDEVYNLEIVKGRNLKKSDKFSVILGYSYLFDNRVFKKAAKLGDKIIIHNKTFKVVGFYSEVGDPQDDKVITMPIETARDLLDISGYNYIIARVKYPEKISEIVSKLTDRLRKHKHENKNEESFYIQTFEELLKTYSSVILIINILLTFIAGISVVVASINIVNSLYTSVFERIKEIGILKSIGAKNIDILFIFSLESTLIGLTGGLIGILLGYIISSILGKIISNLGFSMLSPYYNPVITVLIILFSLIIGFLSGLFPSLNAAKLDPSKSLRYE